jgi:hypothetical protein
VFKSFGPAAREGIGTTSPSPMLVFNSEPRLVPPEAREGMGTPPPSPMLAFKSEPQGQHWTWGGGATLANINLSRATPQRK